MIGNHKLFARWTVAATIVAVPLLLGGFVSKPAAPKPVEVTIIGADYAFVGVPERMRAGQALLSFKNTGKVRHELVIARLAPGTTPEQIVEKLKNGATPRQVINAGGLLFADAGQTSPLQLSLHLARGEQYMLYCNFQDSLTAPRHWALGMYSAFIVK